VKPRFVEALLTLAGHPDAECIAGDLHEEFAWMRPERGAVRAARWCAWQVARTLARPLAERALAVAVVLVLPLAAFDHFWALVFAQVCQAPSDGLLAVNGACLCAGALWTDPARRSAASGILGAALAAAIVIGPDAFPHIVAGLLAVPAGALAARLRKALT
jgi:hypothetical protein